MKQKLVELGSLILASLIILGSYNVYTKIKAHNDMDQQLIELVKRLEKKP